MLRFVEREAQLSAAWLEDAAGLGLEADDLSLAVLSLGAAGTWTIDAAGRFSVGPELTAHLGLEPGKSPIEHLHPAHRTSFLDRLERHRAEDAPFSGEFSFAPRGAGWRRYRCGAASERGSDGQLLRTVVGLLDVSEGRAAEDRAAALSTRLELVERELEQLRAARTPSEVRPRPDGREAEIRRQSEQSRVARARVAVGEALAALPDRLPPPVDLRGLRAAREDLSSLQDLLAELSARTAGWARLDAFTEDLGLVALNARLEALRLGERGGGLAAVASSVKDLSASIRGAALEATSDFERWVTQAAEAERRLEAAIERLERFEAAAGPRAEFDPGPAVAALVEAQALFEGPHRA